MPKLVPLLVLVAALLVGAPAASADDSVVARFDAVSEADQAAVEEFWTPERMREATRQSVARAGAGGGTTATPPDSFGTPWPQRTSRAIGKIFFSLKDRPNLLGECSGAVVNGANNSVVATAAHCLYLDVDGGAHENFYFVPAFDHGFATYEDLGWTAKAFYVRPEWQQGRHLDNLQHDYGFLTLNPKDGRHIAEVTGAHGLHFEAPTPAKAMTIGYPADFPYDGQSLQYCGGAPKRARDARITSGPGTDDNLVLRPCNLTQGVSGGPWIADYDDVADLGTVIAVNSVGGFNTVIGRPLKAGARPLFDAAQTA